MKRYLVFLLLTTGCATMGVPLQQRMDSWVGHTDQDLVNALSYPTRTFTAPNGNTVFAYDRSDSGTNATYKFPTVTTYDGNQAVNSGGATIGGDTWVETCSTFFEVDEAKRIQRVSWQGNGCK